MHRSIWVGFDPREAAAYAVARTSIRAHLIERIAIRGVVLSDLRRRALYWRPTEKRASFTAGTTLFDTISDAPMSTEFAISRFLVPYLAKSGWALFLDADVLVRRDLGDLFDALDPAFAVYCVQHVHTPGAGLKMDGQIQTDYARKNWSSVMVFNVGHPSNARLTLEMINTLPGRDLHRFCWLEDSEIGALDPAWNFLVGHASRATIPEPAIAHFTDGTPDMAGYEASLFASEWRDMLAHWAA